MAGKSAEFTLSRRVEKYKGEEHYTLVGSFKKGSEVFIVNIPCDSAGVPKVYEGVSKYSKSKEPIPFIYARASSFREGAGQKRKSRNEL